MCSTTRRSAAISPSRQLFSALDNFVALNADPLIDLLPTRTSSVAQAMARKAIIEKAKTPPYSSRTSAIIVALRFPRDYATIIKTADVG
jgi:hypothetical protein